MQTEFIDAKARNAFVVNKATTSMMKRARGNNKCGVRDAIMSKNMTTQEGLR